MHGFDATAAPEDEEHVVVACMAPGPVPCSAPSSDSPAAVGERRLCGEVGAQSLRERPVSPNEFSSEESESARSSAEDEQRDEEDAWNEGDGDLLSASASALFSPAAPESSAPISYPASASSDPELLEYGDETEPPCEPESNVSVFATDESMWSGSCRFSTRFPRAIPENALADLCTQTRMRSPIRASRVYLPLSRTS